MSSITQLLLVCTPFALIASCAAPSGQDDGVIDELDNCEPYEPPRRGGGGVVVLPGGGGGFLPLGDLGGDGGPLTTADAFTIIRPRFFDGDRGGMALGYGDQRIPLVDGETYAIIYDWQDTADRDFWRLTLIGSDGGELGTLDVGGKFVPDRYEEEELRVEFDDARNYESLTVLGNERHPWRIRIQDRYGFRRRYALLADVFVLRTRSE